MKKSVDSKREEEKEIIHFMIKLYCKKHHNKKGLCETCSQLYTYACKRIDLCPFMETKTFCNNCKVHCYQKDYREQIKQVMRFSGPRMLLHHPIMTLRHVYYDRKEKYK